MTCKIQKCKYEKKIPGDCHITCVHPLVLKKGTSGISVMLSLLSRRCKPCLQPELMQAMGVRGTKMGIEKGWFNWPFNFDPMWLESCDKFEAAVKC